MASSPVTCGAVMSRVILVGQAPGVHEPKLGRPFAWTAGRTLFRWLHQSCGMDEEAVRRHIYFSAVCRCFPGKSPTGGDRVPDSTEISSCRPWLEREIGLLNPQLLVPVGKLAIEAVLHLGAAGNESSQDAAKRGSQGRKCNLPKLTEIIGRTFSLRVGGLMIDVIPLPHPSGASPWHRLEPGRSLLHQALLSIATHPAMRCLGDFPKIPT